MVIKISGITLNIVLAALIHNFPILVFWRGITSCPAAPTKAPLSWRIRLQIVIDVAAALVGIEG